MAIAPAAEAATDPLEVVASEAVEVADDMGLPSPVADSEFVDVVTDQDLPAALDSPHGVLQMGVNATDDGVQTDMGVVFDVPGKDANVLVHPTATGELRALISIESPLAPERYAFPIAGDVARLVLDKAGGAVAMDASGVAIAYAPAPWAVGANGTRVPTFFEVDGTTLYQVIRHRGREYTYGIVGDPAWAVI